MKRDGRRFGMNIDVRFRDLDAMGHVNNAVMFTYFEEGRKSFFIDELKGRGPSAFNFILARISCDYLLPVKLADRPRLEMWIETIGAKSFTIEYRLVDRDQPRRIFARGESVQVCYDYRKAETIEVPSKLREQLRAYQPA